jgi:glycogen operon protein
MVKALHAAGLEVILDVVYGHTAEGDHRGPTLCFRGIDNATYYRLSDDDRSRYVDYTGCGNTLNTRHRAVLALIMDSLRYWVSEMHVDGFRFDQASTLVRGLHEVDQLSAFFDLIHQDPIMSTVKLIAEPWDVGEGGYQVGKFPAQWAEWNGDYRDAVRDFWRGKGAGSKEMATRLIGSTDLYQAGGRRPYASVNFVTAHDGFTLHDLVTYSTKRNEANGEDNRDGVDDERSWNCGVEGETDDPDVVSLRRRQQRNFLATLLLSQGVPMVFGGDEIDRTQHGNNNAYCQDNEVNWYDWDLSSHAEELLDFTRRLIALRHAHPVFRRSRFFEAEQERGRGTPDVAWFGPDGREMTNMERSAAGFKSLGMFLNGESIREAAVRGPHVANDSFLMIMNAGDPVRFQLPEMRWAWTYEVAINTAFAGGLPPDGQSATAGAGESLDVDELSVLLLRKLS